MVFRKTKQKVVYCKKDGQKPCNTIMNEVVHFNLEKLKVYQSLAKF